MAKNETVISFPTDTATTEANPAGTKHLTDLSLIKGSPIGVGFVPHALAGDRAAKPADFRAGVMDAEYLVFTTAGAATDVTVSHHLGRVPRRVLLVNSPPGVNVQVFRGTTAWTDSRVYLRGSTTGDKVTVEIA